VNGSNATWCRYASSDGTRCQVRPASGLANNRSEDAGATWVEVARDLPQPGAGLPLAFHPTDAQVLIYGGNVSETLGQLFVSEDRGRTWRTLGDLPRIWRVKTVQLDEELG
jgi:hypothetical protein